MKPKTNYFLLAMFLSVFIFVFVSLISVDLYDPKPIRLWGLGIILFINVAAFTLERININKQNK